MALAQNMRLILAKNGLKQQEFKWVGSAPNAPIVAGQPLGEVQFVDDDGTTVRLPVVAKSDVQRASIFNSLDAKGAAWVVLGGAMLMGAWVMRRRVRTA